MFFKKKTKQEQLRSRLILAIHNKKDSVFDAVMADAELDLDAEGQGQHVLFHAISYGRTAYFSRLLEKTAECERLKNDSGHNLLCYAAYDQQFDICRILLDAGCDPDVPDSNGNTALHHAARYGYGAIVRLLLSGGADATLANYHMLTAAELADKDYPRIADMIREHMGQETLRLQRDWELNGNDEIIRTANKGSSGFTLTEIFNFSQQTYVSIVFNAVTKTQSHESKSFADLVETGLVETAAAQMAARGIPVDISHGKPFFPKPMLPLNDDGGG